MHTLGSLRSEEEEEAAQLLLLQADLDQRRRAMRRQKEREFYRNSKPALQRNMQVLLSFFCRCVTVHTRTHTRAHTLTQAHPCTHARTHTHTLTQAQQHAGSAGVAKKMFETCFDTDSPQTLRMQPCASLTRHAESAGVGVEKVFEMCFDTDSPQTLRMQPCYPHLSEREGERQTHTKGGRGDRDATLPLTHKARRTLTDSAQHAGSSSAGV